MFFHQDLRGDRLPPRTLCLTYDDGPGPRTLELGHYLFEQGIPATFFVVGRHVEEYPDVLPQLHHWGHLIASHTYSHAGLVALAESGGDVTGEIQRNQALLAKYAAAGIIFFRAPYGSWRQKKSPDSTEDRAISLVAEILNRSPARQTHVGPVNWDISGHDYDYWRRGATAGECVAEYQERIEAIGRGIVLMHDSSDEELLRSNNRTLETTRLLMPFLRERGYRFVRLDAIPQVRSAVEVVS